MDNQKLHQETLQNPLQADMSAIKGVCEGYIGDCMETLRSVVQEVSISTVSDVHALDRNLQHLFHMHDLLFPKLHKLSVDGYDKGVYDEDKVEALREEWKYLVNNFRGE